MSKSKKEEKIVIVHTLSKHFNLFELTNYCLFPKLLRNGNYIINDEEVELDKVPDNFGLGLSKNPYTIFIERSGETHVINDSSTSFSVFPKAIHILLDNGDNSSIKPFDQVFTINQKQFFKKYIESYKKMGFKIVPAYDYDEKNNSPCFILENFMKDNNL